MNQSSIVDYLKAKGYVFQKQGNRWLTNSPFNDSDRTPSFVVFPDNGFKCFSTGRWGDISTLVAYFLDDLAEVSKVTPVWTAPKEPKRKPWSGKIPKTFLTLQPQELQDVMQYAASRRITEGFQPGRFFEATATGFSYHPALVFPHKDKDGAVTGAKFRAIQGKRFSSSGKLGFYRLEYGNNPEVWLVESESSANSWWEFCKFVGKSVVVLSTGGVTAVPKALPNGIKAGKLIVDYDGDETLYQQRLLQYKHLGLEPVKLPLAKGEDINSLWCQKNLIQLYALL